VTDYGQSGTGTGGGHTGSASIVCSAPVAMSTIASEPRTRVGARRVNGRRAMPVTGNLVNGDLRDTLDGAMQRACASMLRAARAIHETLS
jgi:hypothetical protein